MMGSGFRSHQLLGLAVLMLWTVPQSSISASLGLVVKANLGLGIRPPTPNNNNNPIENGKECCLKKKIKFLRQKIYGFGQIGSQFGKLKPQIAFSKPDNGFYIGKPSFAYHPKVPPQQGPIQYNNIQNSHPKDPGHYAPPHHLYRAQQQDHGRVFWGKWSPNTGKPTQLNSYGANEYPQDIYRGKPEHLTPYGANEAPPSPEDIYRGPNRGKPEQLSTFGANEAPQSPEDLYRGEYKLDTQRHRGKPEQLSPFGANEAPNSPEDLYRGEYKLESPKDNFRPNFFHQDEIKNYYHGANENNNELNELGDYGPPYPNPKLEEESYGGRGLYPKQNRDDHEPIRKVQEITTLATKPTEKPSRKPKSQHPRTNRGAKFESLYPQEADTYGESQDLPVDSGLYPAPSSKPFELQSAGNQALQIGTKIKDELMTFGSKTFNQLKAIGIKHREFMNIKDFRHALKAPKQFILKGTQAAPQPQSEFAPKPELTPESKLAPQPQSEFAPQPLPPPKAAPEPELPTASPSIIIPVITEPTRPCIKNDGWMPIHNPANKDVGDPEIKNDVDANQTIDISKNQDFLDESLSFKQNRVSENRVTGNPVSEKIEAAVDDFKPFKNLNQRLFQFDKDELIIFDRGDKTVRNFKDVDVRRSDDVDTPSTNLIEDENIVKASVYSTKDGSLLRTITINHNNKNNNKNSTTT